MPVVECVRWTTHLVVNVFFHQPLHPYTRGTVIKYVIPIFGTFISTAQLLSTFFAVNKPHRGWFRRKENLHNNNKVLFTQPLNKLGPDINFGVTVSGGYSEPS